MEEFATKEEAYEWMEKTVDDPFIDNFRFAFLDDPEAMHQYTDQQNDGCCGCFDQEIKVAGRIATVGCNYGH
jgi:hypothetical protein